MAVSAAESELYAIGTAARESLYISNFIKEAFEVRVNINTHTDSSAAKSIATREGASNKAKRIELRHRFIQQLVKSKSIATHKIKPEDNPADILSMLAVTHSTNKCMQLASEATATSFTQCAQYVKQQLRSTRVCVCVCRNYISAGLVTCFRVGALYHGSTLGNTTASTTPSTSFATSFA